MGTIIHPVWATVASPTGRTIPSPQSRRLAEAVLTRLRVIEVLAGENRLLCKEGLRQGREDREVGGNQFCCKVFD